MPDPVTVGPPITTRISADEAEALFPEAMQAPASLSWVPVNEDGKESRLAVAMADMREPVPGTVSWGDERAERALILAGELKHRNATILRLRFGLDGQPPLSLREIGERCGLTKERVRQIVKRLLALLRERMEAESGEAGDKAAGREALCPRPVFVRRVR